MLLLQSGGTHINQLSMGGEMLPVSGVGPCGCPLPKGEMFRMPSNGTYRTKVPYRERAFKLGRAAGRKIATAVHRGLVSVGCQTVDTDNDEGGPVPKNAGGDAGKGGQVGIKPGCELMGEGRDAIRSRGSKNKCGEGSASKTREGEVDNTGCKSRRETGGVTNMNEIREVTWKEIHANKSRGSEIKCGEGSASKTGDALTGKGRVDNTGCGPKEYSLHVVGLLLLQRSTNCTHSSCPPQWGPVSTVFWGRPAKWTRWLAGAAAIKSG